MNIGVPTQCMTGGQENSGDEYINTVKYYAEFCFLPDFLFIGDHILLSGLKLGDDVLDMLVLEAIFISHGVDGELILDDSHNPHKNITD